MLITAIVLFGVGVPVSAQEAPPVEAPVQREIVFPVIGDVTFTDDFGEPRSGGRTHEGVDMLGEKMQPLIAAVSGVLQYVPYPQPAWGFMVSIKDVGGYEYNYVHINNDSPGTDDGQADGRYAYAPGIVQGARVRKGQLIGWMGDSGNAEGSSPHLHFEMRTPDGVAFSPYTSLLQAPHRTKPAVARRTAGELLPYGTFHGGASIAVGNLDTDADDELITGAGAGGVPRVKWFDQTGGVIGTSATISFLAFEETFLGGVDVASGDIDGDNIDEVIVGAGAGEKPRVRVFTAGGSLLFGFLAYRSSFTGGLRVSSADLTGDGIDEIITGPGTGLPGRVRIWNAQGKKISELDAFGPEMLSGVDVAATDAGATSPGHIVVSAGSGSKSRVRVYTQDGVMHAGFPVFGKKFRGGVRLNARDEIILVSAATDGAPTFRSFTLAGANINTFSAFEPWWIGGYDVALGHEAAWVISSGGRNVSVRQLE